MSRSKSWIKTLLIVVLALIMVVSLVACDKNTDPEEKPSGGGSGNNETNTQAADYFKKLWDLSAKIGSETIGKDDTIALDLGLELSIGTRQVRVPYQLVQQIDLGIELQAVVDRKNGVQEATAQAEEQANERNNKSAVKLSLYDPSANRQILALYLFADDLENLYVDFSGQSVKVPNNVAEVVWNEVLGNSTYLGDEIPNGLTNAFIGKDGEKQSINDIINTFVGKFGKNWNLNTVINGVMNMFNLKLDELFDKIPPDLLKILGVSSADELKDANGDVDLMKLLSGNLVGSLFDVTQAKTGEATVHKARMKNSILHAVAGLAKITSLFSSNDKDPTSYIQYPTDELALSFTEENDDIKDFTILARLGGIDCGINGTTVVPEIAVKINKLRVQKANEDNVVKIDKANFSSDIALNEKLSIKLDGLQWRNVDLSGKTFELSLVGKVDMTTLATADNKTEINFTVDEITAAGTKHIVQASYRKGIVAAALSDAITFNGKQYKGLKVDVSEKFNVADLITTGIKEIVYKIKPSLRPQDSATTAADNSMSLADVLKMIKKYCQLGLPMISTDNDGLQLDLSKIPGGNLLGKGYDKSLISVIAVFVNNANAHNAEFEKWTIQGCIENTINNLIYPPLPDKGLQDCLNIILAEFNIDLSDYGASTADDQPVTPPAQDDDKVDWNVIGDAVKQILFNIASDLTVAGAECDKDFTKDEITSIIGEKLDADENVIPVSDGTLSKWNENKKLIRSIIALLKTKEVVVKGDITDGAHLSVEFAVADASVEIKESLELIDDYTFDDAVEQLYAEAVENGEDDLWITYTWTDGSDAQ